MLLKVQGLKYSVHVITYNLAPTRPENEEATSFLVKPVLSRPQINDPDALK